MTRKRTQSRAQTPLLNRKSIPSSDELDGQIPWLSRRIRKANVQLTTTVPTGNCFLGQIKSVDRNLEQSCETFWLLKSLSVIRPIVAVPRNGIFVDPKMVLQTRPHLKIHKARTKVSATGKWDHRVIFGWEEWQCYVLRSGDSGSVTT